MKICGIVAEYNPFHNGHKYQIEKIKENTNADAIVAVMSGNFIQRGQPALFDKWTRTKMALLNGVDLIIELPTYYAVSSAEYFATGGIGLLNSIRSCK
ncbi:MAG: nucleotidyltransferase family protein [Clostridia bacterium]|nr:nucleotidyltransferase family protein [Clostridia bacterium]